MRISRIEIEDFQQFRDFSLDLTYPDGHEKAGEPLDKVCFIGQSGTGKTTLLNIIFLIRLKKEQTYPPFELSLTEDVRIHIQSGDLSFDVLKRNAKSVKVLEEKRDKVLELISSFFESGYGITYFPVDDKRKKELEMLVFNGIRNSRNFIHELLLEEKGRESWSVITDEITTHQEEISKFRFRISKAIENGDIEASQQIAKELEAWRKDNSGILEDLAKNFLDPILFHFHLSVKTELDSLKEAQFLTLINQAGETIPDQIWSTGINNIIYKTLPLYSAKPTKHNLILIDEPENSLYPDIQAQIVNHYRQLAPESQLFFATHSPIVAASFEPWEIVELKFDDQGKVYRELHYDGENHVNNYVPDVRYLDYGQVLREVFDVNQVSGDRELRETAQMRLLGLKKEIKALNEEGKTEAAEKLYQEYRMIAEKLEWEVKA